MTLDGLEALEANQPHQGTRRQAKLHVIRFADDFIITVSKAVPRNFEPDVVNFLADEKRPDANMAADLSGIHRLRHAWRLPNGVFSSCREKITNLNWLEEPSHYQAGQ